MAALAAAIAAKVALDMPLRGLKEGRNKGKQRRQDADGVENDESPGNKQKLLKRAKIEAKVDGQSDGGDQMMIQARCLRYHT